ncbi:DUF927 domain-containing protein [Acinetobacter baumannii]|uniref:DUF927 domain-containing protein n=3 Tax=Gammaproteobacteria TaxID=1236 RepID=UPI00396CCDB0
MLDYDHPKELITPKAILNECTQLVSFNDAYSSHPLIQRFGSPEQPIYIDDGSVDINGVIYTQPLIMPIYDGQMELVQCAVMQDGQRVAVIPDGLARGFARYGDFDHDKPVIITYSLEAFFKVAQTGYAVVLVVLPTLCNKRMTALKPFDFEQIQYVINQLSKSGFDRLYMPVRPEHIQLEPFQQLEQNTAVKLLNQYLKIDESEFLIELSKDESIAEVTAFIDEAIDLLPQKERLPKGHLAKPFKIKEGEYLNILMDGLYLVKEHDDGEGGIKRTRTRISDSAIILGEARSLNNNNWKRVIQFNDKDNVQHTLLIPYEHFMGEAQEALKIIANHGLMPPRQPNKKNVFINYIQDYPIEKRFRCVDRTGWHGHSYVTPNKTYGDSSGEELLFNSEMKNPYAVHGSLAGWQELSRLIEPHALGVLAFSCAFSGQLVAPLNLESGGFHIYGSSTDGKSTITKAACSVWGNPREVSKQWRTTDNALENEAELRNDSFLNLDELRQAPPKAVSDIVYMLTGGQGKSRSSKTGKNRDSKQFNLMYTSTGEVTLEEHLRRGGIELDAGLLLRFAHIPSDAGKGYGVFEQINYGSRPQDIGNQINELSSKHYGHAGVKWLEYLTHDKGAVIQTALSQIDDFIQRCSKNIGKKLNGQSNRVLRRFALVAVSGELATKAGITGWQEGRAFNAVEQCFKTWLDGFGTGDNLEENKILEHFKIFIETHGSSRFENLIVSRHQDGEPMTPRINNRVGYYDPDSKMYLVSSAMFKSEMCTGLNESNAKKVLKKYGWIDCAEDGRYVKKVSKVLPDGGRPSLIHFKADVIQNFDE